MSVSLVVGTPKGAAIISSNDRKSWKENFVLRGWPVTASVRDDMGRIYVAVNSPIYGVAIFVSDDFENWTQLASAPRYRPEDRGNPEHHRERPIEPLAVRPPGAKLRFVHPRLVASFEVEVNPPLLPRKDSSRQVERVRLLRKAARFANNLCRQWWRIRNDTGVGAVDLYGRGCLLGRALSQSWAH